jgi:ABC-type transport system involved in Fe-S cluster assembly fused permease/ATPase subunit
MFMILNNFNGADGQIRTGDLLITNQLLYQLSYVGNLLTRLYRSAGLR